MEMTVMAQWLNNFFAGYDNAILSALHELAVQAGTFLTPVMKLISVTGNGGVLMIVLAVLLTFFSRTRKVGVCMLGALLIGSLITNVFLKEWVARPRPYLSLPYSEWWLYVEAPRMRDLSFPSGHATATTAAMMSLWQVKKRGYRIAGCVYVLLMAVSRNYLMVHYPSDVLAGLLIGLLAAFLSCTVVNRVYDSRLVRARRQRIRDRQQNR